MKGENSYIFQRLIVFGDSYVGKTTLLKSFILNKQDRVYAFCNIDFHFQVYEKNNQKIKLQLFDTYGQHRFQFQKEQSKKSNFVLLVYDTTNRDSFDNICAQVIDLIQPSYKTSIILVGNKCDLSSKRQVPFQEGLQLSKQYGFYFYETSALQGISVDGLINDVLDKIIQTQ
ncbi:hypothetical protein ABPG72_000551 [Tetrahymena utriculariae]